MVSLRNRLNTIADDIIMLIFSNARELTIITLMTISLILNWIIVITQKLSPLAYMVNLKESYYIKEVFTDSQALLKEGILYQLTLDQDKFKIRENIIS